LFFLYETRHWTCVYVTTSMHFLNVPNKTFFSSQQTSRRHEFCWTRRQYWLKNIIFFLLFLRPAVDVTIWDHYEMYFIFKCNFVLEVFIIVKIRFRYDLKIVIFNTFADMIYNNNIPMKDWFRLIGQYTNYFVWNILFKMKGREEIRLLNDNKK